MIYPREAENKDEEQLSKRCYKAGMRNPWASGKADRELGGFTVEEDRLNKNSIGFFDDIGDLKEFFLTGNWCLGQGVIYQNLFFLQQVNGGDEWATYLITEDKIKQFESISFIRMIQRGHDYQGRSFEEYITDLVNKNHPRLKEVTA